MARKSSLDMKDLNFKVYPPTEAAFNTALSVFGFKSKRVLLENMLFAFTAAEHQLLGEEEEELQAMVAAQEKTLEENKADLGTVSGAEKERLEYQIAQDEMNLGATKARLETVLALHGRLPEIAAADPSLGSAGRYLFWKGSSLRRDFIGKQLEVFKCESDPKYRRLREANVQVAGWALPDGSEPDEDGKE